MDAEQLQREFLKLADLLSMGFIDEAEYNRRKAELYEQAATSGGSDEPIATVTQSPLVPSPFPNYYAAGDDHKPYVTPTRRDDDDTADPSIPHTADYYAHFSNSDTSVIVYYKNEQGIFQSTPLDVHIKLSKIGEMFNVDNPYLEQCGTNNSYMNSEDLIPAGHYVLKQKYKRPYRGPRHILHITGKVLNSTFSSEKPQDVTACEAALGDYPHGFVDTGGVHTFCGISSGGGTGSCSPPATGCRPFVRWSLYRGGQSKLEQLLKRRLTFDKEKVEKTDSSLYSSFHWGCGNAVSAFRQWFDCVEEWKRDNAGSWAEEEQERTKREETFRKTAYTEHPPEAEGLCEPVSAADRPTEPEGVVLESDSSEKGVEITNEALAKHFPWFTGTFPAEDQINLHDTVPQFQYINFNDLAAKKVFEKRRQKLGDDDI
jgi:hypothetical protein